MNEVDLGNIKSFIKQKILVEGLELEDVTAADIDDYQPLFGEGLELDSIEAFQVMTLVGENYDVTFEGMSALQIRDILYSVQTISEFIYSALNAESASEAMSADR